MLAGAGWSVRVEEVYIVYFSINKIGLKIVEGLCGVEPGLTVVVGELGDKAKV
jgi:hypothetical protein